MELVWESGKILARGPSGKAQKLKPDDRESDPTRNTFPNLLTNLYGTEYKSLNDTQIVPKHEVTNLDAPSPLQPFRASPQYIRPEERLSRSEEDRLMKSKNPELQAGSEENATPVNFSFFHIPQAMIKTFNARNNGITRLPRPSSCPGLSVNEELKSDERRSILPTSNPIESTLVNTANGSKSITNLQNQQSLTKRADFVLPNSEPVEESLPDEQSAALGRRDISKGKRPCYQVQGVVKAKNICEAGRSTGPPVPSLIPSSSVCSRGASNHPVYSRKERYEDIEESTYSSNDVDEESEDMIREPPTRRSRDAKRKRPADFHNSSEGRRRDKINKKIRALQELIPHCNKVDRASMLDEVIEYLKTLQLQVQMMSMGTGYCMPPMMLPFGIQQMNTPQLPHYSPMGMRMNAGPVYNPAQFLQSPIPGATTLNGFGDPRHMFGIPSQAMQMPFFTSPECPQTQSVPLPDRQMHKSASFSSLNSLMKNPFQETMTNENPESSKIRTFCQAPN